MGVGGMGWSWRRLEMGQKSSQSDDDHHGFKGGPKFNGYERLFFFEKKKILAIHDNQIGM